MRRREIRNNVDEKIYLSAYALFTAKIIAVSSAAAFLLSEISEHNIGDIFELLVHLPKSNFKCLQEVDLLILKYSPNTYKLPSNKHD
jgi:hypothetical protein